MLGQFQGLDPELKDTIMGMICAGDLMLVIDREGNIRLDFTEQGRAFYEEQDNDGE